MTFLEFAGAHGLILNSLVVGRWMRVPTTDHPHKRNGAALYLGDYGLCQNWATMEKPEVWHDGRARTPSEQRDQAARIAKAQEQYLLRKRAGQARAAEKAKWILSQCELDRHAYLGMKGFPKMESNVWCKEGQDPLLVVPMLYRDDVCGCQLISISGEKKFLTGQRTSDAYFKIGSAERTFIVEGFASALSLQALLSASKIPATIYTAFSAGNATRLAKNLPGAFWVADNDASKTGEKAAIASGLDWWMPSEGDVNDYHMKVGLFRASQELKMVLCAT